MTKLKECGACGEHFNFSDGIIKVEDDENFYHEDCLELVPTGLFATLGDEPLGQVESEPDWAMCVLEEGEYVDHDKERD